MSTSLKLACSAARGLYSVFGSRARGRVGILLYHRVQPWSTTENEPTYNIRPDLFRQQIAGLIYEGYRFIPLDELVRALRGEVSLPPRSVVLTFDDAYESVYRHAYPVLRELNVPATAFLATDYLDSPDPFPFDRWAQRFHETVSPDTYRPLRVEQCREMAASGIFQFGAHTHTHQDFRDRPDELRRDLKHSIKIVRDLFGYKQVTFAFPYGKSVLGFAGGKMAEAARAAGASCALTTDCALVDPLADDRFTWGRFSAGDWDTAKTLAAKLAGWYGWAPKLRGYVDRVRGFDRSADYDPPIFIDGTTTRPPIAEPDAAGAIESLYTAPVGDVRIVEVPEAGERIDGIPGSPCAGCRRGHRRRTASIGPGRGSRGEKLMKCLLVHNHYQCAGGEDSVFEDEAALLEDRGHEVVRYTVHNDSIRDGSRWKVAKNTVWNRRVHAELKALMLREKPDVMHCTNTFPLISPAAYYAARAAGVPVVQSLHNYRIMCAGSLLMRDGAVCEKCVGRSIGLPGVIHGCYRGSRAGSAVVAALQSVHWALGTWTRMVDAYIVLNEFAREKFIAGGLPADKLYVKPNFVHPDPQLGTGRGGYAIFVGRLSQEKGISTLLAALARRAGRSAAEDRGRRTRERRGARSGKKLRPRRMAGPTAARRSADAGGRRRHAGPAVDLLRRQSQDRDRSVRLRNSGGGLSLGWNRRSGDPWPHRPTVHARRRGRVGDASRLDRRTPGRGRRDAPRGACRVRSEISGRRKLQAAAVGVLPRARSRAGRRSTSKSRDR